MDGDFPPGQLNHRITSSLDASYLLLNAAPSGQTTQWPPNLQKIDFSLLLDYSLLNDGDLFVFSDGSHQNDVASYGYVIFSGVSWRNGISLLENHGRLTSRKTILDAETYAIIKGLRAALTLDHRERIFLLSDSQSALRLFLPRLVADFASLTPEALNLTLSTDRPILPTWVKGHSGNLGNTRADLLARTATVTSDNHPGPSYSHLNLTIRTQYSTEWAQWFTTTPHYYTRKPTHSRRHHRHHTRLDSVVLFKLRSNKGWDPSDPIGTSPPSPCFCDGTSPRDGSHILECPVYSRA